MGKQAWALEDGDNGFWITRIVDTGAVDENKNPILRKSSTYREDAQSAINEIRTSLDIVLKELRKAEEPVKPVQTQPQKPNKP